MSSIEFGFRIKLLKELYREFNERTNCAGLCEAAEFLSKREYPAKCTSVRIILIGIIEDLQPKTCYKNPPRILLETI